jgi:hypothetical protein
VDELKQCPDCAEMVRAQARVCRFCGYRFAPPPAASAVGSLAGLLVRRPRQVPLPDLLAGWGVELDDGDAVGFFGYCQLDGAYGFLLITDRRVAFFAGRQADTLIDWRLPELRAIEPERRWGSARLRLDGPDRSVVLGRFESAAARDEIASRLRSAAAG